MGYMKYITKLRENKVHNESLRLKLNEVIEFTRHIEPRLDEIDAKLEVIKTELGLK